MGMATDQLARDLVVDIFNREIASFLGESALPSFHTLATKLILTIAPCVVMVVVLRRRILRLV